MIFNFSDQPNTFQDCFNLSGCGLKPLINLGLQYCNVPYRSKSGDNREMLNDLFLCQI